MDISSRLYTVATAVTPGRRVADIGTDHGYVPIHLVKNGICPSALAMDINKGPLARAQEHILKEGLAGRIETRLSDGLMELGPGEADSIVIAGMGGDLISSILSARKDILEEGPELILSPQSEWYKVRHTLHDLSYAIKNEWFLKEEGKYYLVLKALPGQQHFDEEACYCYGAFLEEECKTIYGEYLEKEEKKRLAILHNISSHLKERGENGSEAGKKRKKELEEEISFIRQRLAVL